MPGLIANVRNKRALDRYSEFVSAMDMVEQAFDTVMKVIKRVDDSAEHTGFTVASKDELKAMHTKAFQKLDAVRRLGKLHEGDLVSREWTV